uniref:Uncharacterized protein n=1 Tax=Arundo donax TaxID=35708 RepID=A0A0A9GKH3_ARUDO
MVTPFVVVIFFPHYHCPFISWTLEI